MSKLLAAVIAAALFWSGYWLIGAQAARRGVEAWFEARRAEGWAAGYADLSVWGFPNRFDVTLDAVELSDPEAGLAWSAPYFQLFALSYRPHHVIAVWPHEQQIETPLGNYRLISHDMRASLVVAASTTLAPKRAVLTAASVWASVRWPRSEYMMFMSSSIDRSRNSSTDSL